MKKLLTPLLVLAIAILLIPLGTRAAGPCTGPYLGGLGTCYSTGYVNGITPHTVILGNGTSTVSTTSPSNSGYVLTSNGVNADPTFQPATGGGGTNYLTNSGANTFLNTGTNLQAPVLVSTSTVATSTMNLLQIGNGSAVSSAAFTIDGQSAYPEDILHAYSNGVETNPFFGVDNSNRAYLNAATLIPTNGFGSEFTIAHDFVNRFDPLLNTGVQQSWPLTLLNTSSINASSTGIGFTVSNVGATGSMGAGILFKRAGSNSMGELQFLNHENATAGAALTEAMVISDGGLVGIGTSTPAQKLSVNGTIYSGSGGFQFPDGSIQTTAASGGITGTIVAGQSVYATGASTVASVATSTLSAGAGLSSTGTLGYLIGGSAGALILDLTRANTWTGLQQFNANASSTQMTVTGNTYLATASGFVGVGTSTPTVPLDVHGLSNFDTFLSATSNAGGNNGYVNFTTNRGFVGYNSSDNALRLQSGGSKIIEFAGNSSTWPTGSAWGVFSTAGLFGLGTTTPTAESVIVAASSTVPTTAYNGNVQIIAGLENGVTKLFQEISQFGDLVFQSDAPTLGACGTSPSVAATSNQTTGTINIGSGVVSTCAVLFVHPKPGTTHVFLNEDSGTVVQVDAQSISSTGFTITSTGSISSLVVSYWAVGSQ